jgi:hypothetical protein
MSRFVGLLLCCLAVSGCVPSETAQNAERDVRDGWTLIEGPVAYDDGDLLRGELAIYARGAERLGTFDTDNWDLKGAFVGPRPGAEAFTRLMMARTGCRPIGSVQSNPAADYFRMVLSCS